MKSFKLRRLCATLGGCGVLVASIPALADPLALAQSPAGSVAITPPAPNLILTLDNSNSMNDGVRMPGLRTALTTAFSAANVPDGAIRLGWNTINPLDWDGGRNWGGTRDCSEFKSTGPACGPQGNMLRPLTAAHRANFIAWVNAGSNVPSSNNGLQGFGNTPTLHGYFNALKQYDLPATNANSPWAEVPGESAGKYLSCRKSYVMLLTDGDYNRFDDAGISVGGSYDLDSKSRTLGDGTTVYDPTQSYGNIYKQTQWGAFTATNHLENSVLHSQFNTISDLAFHYWAKDSDGLTSNNNVAPTFRVTATENGIDEFWNPKNDPATWQHVNTYTIGYGTTAAGWATSPRLSGTESLYDSADLARLMTGDLSWPSQTFSTVLIQQEMMHAAINGRGKFYPARTAQDVVDAVKDMLNDVIPVSAQHVTSAAGSSLSALVDSTAFYVKYDSKKWSGDVAAVSLKKDTGGVDTSVSPWGSGVTAASLLDGRTPGSRNILSSKISATTPPTLTGISFLWNNLSSDEQTALRETATVDATTTALGTGRVDYLRGVRTGEGTTYRSRDSVLGDIVNSSVWYMRGVPNAGYTSSDYLQFTKAQVDANRIGALFVGANDGMLHAFNASTGQELFSYVPLGAYANLASLTKPTYAHKYFVDGSPFTADYCANYSGTTCTSWKTMLVGFMGAGGKGYFMLDVTDPAAVTASSVKMDTTNGQLPGSAVADPDLGYITQKPVTEKSNAMASRQIARMNNGKWALVTGNGYNSTDEKAVLIVQYLDGTAPTKIYATTVAGQGNGLSAPRLIDLNGDGRPDVAYAGDLLGNLYKFDLASTNSADWKVAGGQAMFQAAISGTPQPITTAPIYQPHPTKGLMVIFGTGRNLTEADRTNTATQSFYGLYDYGFKQNSANAGGMEISAASNMSQSAWSQPWTRSSAMVAQTTGVDGKTSSGLDVAADGINAIGTTYRGWYYDLPVSRERVLRNPKWYDGDLVDLYSDVPAASSVEDDPCSAVQTSAASYYTTVLNAIAGNTPTLDVWSDSPTSFNRSETALTDIETRSSDKAISTCVGTDCDATKGPTVRTLLGSYFKTPSWRQME